MKGSAVWVVLLATACPFPRTNSYTCLTDADCVLLDERHCDASTQRCVSEPGTPDNGSSGGGAFSTSQGLPSSMPDSGSASRQASSSSSASAGGSSSGMPPLCSPATPWVSCGVGQVCSAGACVSASCAGDTGFYLLNDGDLVTPEEQVVTQSAKVLWDGAAYAVAWGNIENSLLGIPRSGVQFMRVSPQGNLVGTEVEVAASGVFSESGTSFFAMGFNGQSYAFSWATLTQTKFSTYSAALGLSEARTGDEPGFPVHLFWTGSLYALLTAASGDVWLTLLNADLTENQPAVRAISLPPGSDPTLLGGWDGEHLRLAWRVTDTAEGKAYLAVHTLRLNGSVVNARRLGEVNTSDATLSGLQVAVSNPERSAALWVRQPVDGSASSVWFQKLDGSLPAVTVLSETDGSSTYDLPLGMHPVTGGYVVANRATYGGQATVETWVLGTQGSLQSGRETLVTFADLPQHRNIRGFRTAWGGSHMGLLFERERLVGSDFKVSTLLTLRCAP